MFKEIRDFSLVEKKEWPKSVLLKLHSQESLPEILPGQFVQVRVDNSAATYLRRPISIHYVLPEKNEIGLLIQKVGPGTNALAALPLYATVNLLFPLGHPFSIPSPEDKPNFCLLIGGGVGIAPLLYLGQQLAKLDCHPVFLFGARSKNDLIQMEAFEAFGKVYVTTEDGSAGVKGFVTDHPLLKEMTPDRIYTCGPKPMMMAVARYAKQKQVWCEVSLENMMACGVGACLCCVENTPKGHVCVCKEGPVFNINQLSW